MKLFRGHLFSPTANPFERPTENHIEVADGYVLVDDSGLIAATGHFDERPSNPDLEVVDRGRDILIVPGFVDTHLHAPQLEMIGSYGGHLLEWLNRYTFPTEARFADVNHAREIASALFDELLRHGTLTALIFSTVHEGATSAFFEEAERRGVRAIIGKTMMDRNAPDNLLEDPEESYEASRRLLTTWHGRGLLRYAITPRFAPTSTPRLLELAGKLKREFPDAYVHTHISENVAEVAWVRELFPEADSYAEVYREAGLLGERSILAHGVHLEDRELTLLAATRTKISHCPNSNLFLGSGLFPLRRILDHGVEISLGSDIGAGTTPSMFTAMADAYKVQQVQGVSLTPFQLWYLATLGGAEALCMGDETGSLEAGKDADFNLLDLRATSLLSLRTEGAESLQDLLAGLIFMGDDRVVLQSYVKGRLVSSRT
ncbi:MAG TPA: guanine deaminase [Thermoanaerobaculia bacterium]|nr:guanine deaminase [Thermoanaerobaculia bacterium]